MVYNQSSLIYLMIYLSLFFSSIFYQSFSPFLLEQKSSDFDYLDTSANQKLVNDSNQTNSLVD